MHAPYKIDVPDTVLRAIMQRVSDYPWPRDHIKDGWCESWEIGTNIAFLRSLCEYWCNGYDWRRWETHLNRLPQFIAQAADGDLHFYQERGSGPAPPTLLLLHGWPGSIFEFQELIEPLAHPERFGGVEADSFTVVVPSLPGYGFSGRPRHPIGPREMARRINRLMTDELGFTDYIVQGGDWGAIIGGWLAYDAPACKALHLNLMGWDSPGSKFETDEERAYAAQYAAIVEDGMGYAHLHRTRPQSLSLAMHDSPVGVCAWIVEKFHGWSDTRSGFENAYTFDQLLTNVMIYLVTDTFNTAAWAYKGRALERANDTAPAGSRISKPTAIANFPCEFVPFPPRSFVERSINVVRWTDFEKGGHFPALERKDDLVEDVRAFVRALPESARRGRA